LCDLETSKEEAKSPLKGCEYKPTMDCDAERKKNISRVCQHCREKTTSNDKDDEKAENDLERNSRGLIGVLFLNFA